MNVYCDHGTSFSGSCDACKRIEADAAGGFDVIDKPSHYTQGPVECVDAMQSAATHDEFVGFLKLQVFKYIWRCGSKDDALQDAKKAEWYAARLVVVLS